MILKEKPIHPVNNDREFKSVPLTAMGVGKMLHRMSLTSQMEWVFFFPVDFTVPLQVANLDILEKCLKKTNVLRISAIDQSHNAKHIIKFIDRSQYAGNLDIGGFIFKSGDFTKIYKVSYTRSPCILVLVDGPWMTRITHRGNVYCISMKRIVSDNEASERTVIPRSGSK
ncbi:hypothetical protein PFISCL1PPCAC_24568 [Pristionchus fissidentatus]|uniref:Uncharacterized protein n=1 Tax=Pristionchus fissidentatus TaxID=1538716 RepID=A0AAV5WLW0_9BILA|nr:hypothetical protein PFISCL1PPCAC_24568 [Pristionchus fissidentatus]